MKTAKYFISIMVIILFIMLSGNPVHSLEPIENSYIFFSNSVALTQQVAFKAPFNKFSLDEAGRVSAIWKSKDNTLEIVGSGKINRTKWFEMIDKFNFQEETSTENKQMPWLHREIFALRIVDKTVQLPDDSSYLFAGFNGELYINPNIDTSNVVDMSSMFLFSMTTNPDVSNWNTSNVKNFRSMFSITAAVPDVSNWDTSSAEDFSHMFSYSHNADPDVSNWNTSNVKDMSYMFFKSRLADPDVSKWDTHNVVNMKEIFAKSKSANPNISNWVINNKADEKTMFLDAQAYQKGNSNFQSLPNNSQAQDTQTDKGDFSMNHLYSGALRMSSSSSTRNMFPYLVILIVILIIVVVTMILLRRRDIKLYEEEIMESDQGSRLLQIMSVLLLIGFFLMLLGLFAIYEEIKLQSGLGNSFKFSMLMTAIKHHLAYDKRLIPSLLMAPIQVILVLILGMMGMLRWKMPFKYKSLLNLIVVTIIIRTVDLMCAFLFNYDAGNPISIIIAYISLGLYFMGVIHNKNIYERSLKVNQFGQRKIYQTFDDEDEYIGGYRSSDDSDYYGQASYGGGYANGPSQNAYGGYQNRNVQNPNAGAYHNQNRNMPPAYGNNRYRPNEEEYNVYTSQEDYIRSNVVSLDKVNNLGNRTVRNSAFTNEDMIAQTTNSFSNTNGGNVNFRDSGFGYYGLDEQQDNRPKSEYPQR